MTATEKTINEQDNFGSLIDKKTVKWAIDNNKITDYKIIIIDNTKDEINEIMNDLNIKHSEKELFISAYATLKSLSTNDNLTHIVIYANKTSNADQLKNFIDQLLDKQIINIDKNDIYNNSLHSNYKMNISEEIEQFKNSKYGIISCVYIFGEGFDLPKLNGVCFAENMESEIRIVQCALRANRLDKYFPNKISYIIIPYIENDDKSYKKCRTVIRKLRNEDETIVSKITVKELLKNNYSELENDSENPGILDNSYYQLSENAYKLHQIKLSLKDSKIIEYDENMEEYNLIKQLNIKHKIISKRMYRECNHANYIKDSSGSNADPRKYFRDKEVWINWIDFLGLNFNDFIKTKEEWHIKIRKFPNVNTLEDYYQLCKKHPIFPEDPGEFYKDFTNLKEELKKISRR